MSLKVSLSIFISLVFAGRSEARLCLQDPVSPLISLPDFFFFFALKKV